jgi:hypothetical protein
MHNESSVKFSADGTSINCNLHMLFLDAINNEEACVCVILPCVKSENANVESDKIANTTATSYLSRSRINIPVLCWLKWSFRCLLKSWFDQRRSANDLVVIFAIVMRDE